MFRILILFIFLVGTANAQVIQSGPVTPGHTGAWATDNVLQDAGPATDGILTELGTQNAGYGYCQNSAPITGAYTQLCTGFLSGSNAVISAASYGGAPPATLSFMLNGSLVPFTGPFLPLAGGAMNNGAQISSGLTTSLSANPNPTIQNIWTYAGTGGVNTTVDVANLNQVNITSAVGQSVWMNRDTIIYNAASASTTGASYVPRVMDGISQTDRGWGATHPMIWGAISNAIDQTNHNSSVAGGLLTHEFDIEAAGLDDASPGAGRQGIVILAQTHNYPTNTSSEYSIGLGMFTNGHGEVFKTPILIGAPYNVAAIQLSTATSVGGAPAIQFSNTQTMDFGGNFRQGGDATLGGVSFTQAGTKIANIRATGIEARGSANNVVMSGNSAGNAPFLQANGTDTDININLAPKGAGKVDTASLISARNGIDVSNASIRAVGTNNSVLLTGTAGSTAPSVSVQSTNTDSNLSLAAKGVGTIDTTYSITARGGVVATTLQSTTTSTVSNVVSTFGSCGGGTTGKRGVVTDATAPTFLGALVGGGTVVSPIFCNGSSWVSG